MKKITFQITLTVENYLGGPGLVLKDTNLDPWPRSTTFMFLCSEFEHMLTTRFSLLVAISLC